MAIGHSLLTSDLQSNKIFTSLWIWDMSKFEHKFTNSLYSSNIFLFILLKRTHSKLKEY